jgi:hypothetical protein
MHTVQEMRDAKTVLDAACLLLSAADGKMVTYCCSMQASGALQQRRRRDSCEVVSWAERHWRRLTVLQRRAAFWPHGRFGLFGLARETKV